MMNGAGYAGLDAMVAGVQQHYPNHHFQLTSPIDAYQDRLRFTWELAVEGAPAVVTGTDFGVLAADGRLYTITGFFDPKPA